MERITFVIRLSVSPRELIGPLSISEIFEGLKVGEVRWTDIVFQPGSDWQRLCDFKPLRLLMEDLPPRSKLEKYARICLEHLNPPVPAPSLPAGPVSTPQAVTSAAEAQLSKADSPAPPPGSIQVPPRFSPVYLCVQGKQHGPMNGDEARAWLQEMKTRDQVYLWYRGLRTWFPVQEIPEFADLSFGPSRMKPIPNDITQSIGSREYRLSVRKGLVATISERRAGGAQGVVLDISMSGFQARFEEGLRFGERDEVEFELVPLRILALPRIEFRAKVMWVNPDENRVGFSFVQFRADAKELLDAYVQRANLPHQMGE